MAHSSGVVVVVGVDACKAGWIAVAVDDTGVLAAHYLPAITSLTAAVPEASVVGIDIPIGLPESGRREADVAARSRLGARRNSVFFTPPRAAVEAASHAEATAASMRLTGFGVSQQSFALAPKLREVDKWIQQAPVPVYEVHPEISFAVLLGAPASAQKKSWAGVNERRRRWMAPGSPSTTFTATLQYGPTSMTCSTPPSPHGVHGGLPAGRP